MDLALHVGCPILEELRVDLCLLDQPWGAQHTVTTGGTEMITATKRKLESMLPADTVHIGGASITTKTSPLLLDVPPPKMPWDVSKQSPLKRHHWSPKEHG